MYCIVLYCIVLYCIVLYCIVLYCIVFTDERVVLFQLIMDNLTKFNSSVLAEKPLFQVETLLAVPDVVLHPAANEIYKYTLQCVRDCVEGYVSPSSGRSLIYF